jgi:hypothetical protein
MRSTAARNLALVRLLVEVDGERVAQRTVLVGQP